MTLSVRPATADEIEAFVRDPAEFARCIDSDVPAGWPEFPEAFEFAADTLRRSPADANWWLHLFLVDGRLVGSGGFVGPPDDGVVEIGYEIAPELRGRGYATAAAGAMIAKADAAGVHTVIAHTLPVSSPSTGVLRTLGFRHTGEVDDPADGTLWRWELAIP